MPLHGGEVKELFTVKNIYKLVSIDASNNKLLILKNNNNEKEPYVIDLNNGSSSKLNYDQSDQTLINHLKGWERQYDDIKVYEKLNENEKVLNVYIKKGTENSIKLTNCSDLNCGQPSLSNDKDIVVYIEENKHE